MIEIDFTTKQKTTKSNNDFLLVWTDNSFCIFFVGDLPMCCEIQ